jgi:hypothetical protein
MARTLTPTIGSRFSARPFTAERDRSDLDRVDRRGVPVSRVVDEYWGSGRVGRIARSFLDGSASQSVETLERRTDRNRDEQAVVLHSRRLPRSGQVVDHIVVAPSGVWVIDSNSSTGKVTERNVGGWFKQESQLCLDDTDQTRLLDAIGRASDAVEWELGHLDVSGLTLDRVICFTAAEWPRVFAKPLRISDTWVTWPGNLAELIVADGPLDVSAISTVAAHLDASLRPVSRRTPG